MASRKMRLTLTECAGSSARIRLKSPGRNTPAGLAGKPSLKCTYALDDTQSPAHFNWTVGEGDRQVTINAIYELKGDVLRVCFAKRGEPRPDGFETKGKK
jgi:uncharacterized protein (TIGR03067 family)